jgi:Flp pilus assembly protein TadD
VSLAGQAPVLVLGMHRSGTSCVAGMLAAHGVVPAGNVVRNWDNARGHFESTRAVRLNEAVLAYSGGHWLSPPADLRWTAAQAAERDALLAIPNSLLKDPRTLLTLPFWRASSLPLRLLGIVRAPLAVARSLSSWRQLPLATGLALWEAHNRVLLSAHREASEPFPLLDFESEETEFLAAVEAAFTALGVTPDPAVLRQAYARELVHHDALLDAGAEALAVAAPLKLYADLRARRGNSANVSIPRAQAFPWPDINALRAALASGDPLAAARHARQALATPGDIAAIAVPVVADLLRAGHGLLAAEVLAAAPELPAALRCLLQGKIALANGEVQAAVSWLRQAVAVTDPFWEARQLLPQALRLAGANAEARATQLDLVADALYPHGLLATLAEWAWSDGDQEAALTWSQQAIAAAPLRRRGRLRARRAAWLRQRGDQAGGAEQLALAEHEDPAFFLARRTSPHAKSRVRDLS